MSNANAELQKEFELERMILFSDAVFAIAITLLIIEIKFPEIEKGATSQETWVAFKPVVREFIPFVVSFFFIGVTWARHLTVCKYLRAYDSGVIARNLLLLFFVVCFPFTASGLAHSGPSTILLPFIIYFIHVTALMFSQFALCHYFFRKKQNLSVPGFEAEKTYLLMQSKYLAILLLIGVCIIIALSFIYPNNDKYVLYGFYPYAFVLILYRRYIKRYKKKNGIELS
jgi:uncharacterized membrane protein